ncbi:MAG: hypothetical protein WA628_16850 [Terriglobales bacterium]
MARTNFVSVENSSVHDVDGEGIFAAGSSTPGLKVSLRRNVASPNAGLVGIILANVGGVVGGNDVNNALFGIGNLGPGGARSIDLPQEPSGSAHNRANSLFPGPAEIWFTCELSFSPSTSSH